MGRIKSALEIALERTESVKSDRAGIEQFEAKRRGIRLANEYLEDSKTVSLGEAIKKAPKDEQEALKQGIFDVLLSQLNLPVSPEDETRLAAAGKGLESVIGNARFSALFKQFSQALSRYLDEAARYEEAIKRQYAPKLRQKEEEIARRIGHTVKLDPFQDPEFTAFYNQNMNSLKANYQTIVDQVREQAVLMFGTH
ncbi:MAG: hypothetical protein LBG76_11175 [Treponema sp.]|jgi:uncharacterized protein YukE|nr:hypothetical protein [Treponema sp.]